MTEFAPVTSGGQGTRNSNQSDTAKSMLFQEAEFVAGGGLAPNNVR